MSLISGASASTTFITPYATAVIAFVLGLAALIIGFTFALEHSRYGGQVALTTVMGILCGGMFIVFGQVVLGLFLVFGCFIFFVLYRTVLFLGFDL